jgi:hypothetical protein
MESKPPPSHAADAPAKRPRWLVLALVASLFMGAECWTKGCDRLSYYRGEQDNHAALEAQLKDDATRARAEALYKRFTDLADSGRTPAVPFAAATLVLGAALLAFAGRSLAGRTHTRSALVQVVAAQAIVVAAGWYLTRGIRQAELDWELVALGVPDPHNTARYIPATWIGLRTFASLLVVIALTRARSRELLGAPTDPVSD